MNVHTQCLTPDDCILLLVDIQKTILDLCIDGEKVRENSARLIDTAGIFNIPIFFSVQNTEKLGGFLPQLLERIPQPKVFNKLEFSCFDNEAISGVIGEVGRRTLLIAGIEGHICIFQTAVGALRAGYRTHVAADAVSSRSAFNRDKGLERLDRAGAVISSTEMIIFELLNRAGTREFRAALPMLKAL